MPLTASEPKSFTSVTGRRILDWTMDAFKENWLDRFVFIGGYLIDVVRKTYPDFTFVENKDWANNNILFSLMYAREHLLEGFYATYTDTLFLGNAVKALKESPHDITVVMDTKWRERYKFRSLHPESDGEKMIAKGDSVVRLSRTIPSEEASGEYTGVIKMTARGAAQFVEFFDSLHKELGTEKIIAENRTFRMAYVIHQLDRMLDAGVKIHCVRIPGDYHEIGTLEDHALASKDWDRRFGKR